MAVADTKRGLSEGGWDGIHGQYPIVRRDALPAGL